MIVKLSNKKYMQIEQFDTGLKGQEKVEKIVISPEENYNYKQVVRKYLNSVCLLYTSPSPRDRSLSRMPSSA